MKSRVWSLRYSISWSLIKIAFFKDSSSFASGQSVQCGVVFGLSLIWDWHKASMDAVPSKMGPLTFVQLSLSLLTSQMQLVQWGIMWPLSDAGQSEVLMPAHGPIRWQSNINMTWPKFNCLALNFQVWIMYWFCVCLLNMATSTADVEMRSIQTMTFRSVSCNCNCKKIIMM